MMLWGKERSRKAALILTSSMQLLDSQTGGEGGSEVQPENKKQEKNRKDHRGKKQDKDF